LRNKQESVNFGSKVHLTISKR